MDENSPAQLLLFTAWPCFAFWFGLYLGLRVIGLAYVWVRELVHI
jgi:hypothetical protein